MDGAPDELRTGLKRQLLLDVFPVGFNRLETQMKALRDQARAFRFFGGHSVTPSACRAAGGTRR